MNQFLHINSKVLTYLSVFLNICVEFLAFDCFLLALTLAKYDADVAS